MEEEKEGVEEEEEGAKEEGAKEDEREGEVEEEVEEEEDVGGAVEAGLRYAHCRERRKVMYELRQGVTE